MAGPVMRSSKALVLRVKDGDTAKFSVQLRRHRGKNSDLGFHVYIEDGWMVVHESMRFYRINAAEHGTSSGDTATKWLSGILKPGMLVTVETVKVESIIDKLPDDQVDKYGRFLADVILPNGKCVNDLAVSTGHAVYWDGHGPRPVPGG